MAKNKDTFIFREKWFEEKFNVLTDAEIVLILKSVIKTHQTGEIVNPSDDRLVTVTYREIIADIMETDARYEETCQKRRESGRRGGLAKAANTQQTETEDVEEPESGEPKCVTGLTDECCHSECCIAQGVKCCGACAFLKTCKSACPSIKGKAEEPETVDDDDVLAFN